mmetsp:Transcript_9463/g.1410  ORF Transcript_9463/g.1410 Transcript_9463/m.1410 type:complete len:104 (-) Transcript_9463:1349-1660(-)
MFELSIAPILVGEEFAYFLIGKSFFLDNLAVEWLALNASDYLFKVSSLFLYLCISISLALTYVYIPLKISFSTSNSLDLLSNYFLTFGTDRFTFSLGEFISDF